MPASECPNGKRMKPKLTTTQVNKINKYAQGTHAFTKHRISHHKLTILLQFSLHFKNTFFFCGWMHFLFRLLCFHQCLNCVCVCVRINSLCALRSGFFCVFILFHSMSLVHSIIGFLAGLFNQLWRYT